MRLLVTRPALRGGLSGIGHENHCAQAMINIDFLIFKKFKASIFMDLNYEKPVMMGIDKRLTVKNGKAAVRRDRGETWRPPVTFRVTCDWNHAFAHQFSFSGVDLKEQNALPSASIG